MERDLERQALGVQFYMNNMDKTSKNDIMVSICCTAYNHAPYIRQCLDGFVMQQTTFSFEILIHDDASTDDTADIIREYEKRYPHLIKPIYQKENQYSKGVKIMATYNFPRARGKYIAMCEGDDYWTDPLKLQKQVDLLEQNPHVVMVYTGFQTVDKNGRRVEFDNFEYYKKKSKSGDVFRLLLQSNFIMTLTTCYRKECIVNNPILENCPSTYDYALFLTVASMGDVAYLSEKTACYRRVPTGMVATQSSSIAKWSDDVFYYFANLFLDGNTKSFSKAEKRRIKTEIIYHYLNVRLKGGNGERLKYFLEQRKLWGYVLPASLICFSRIKWLKSERNKYR